MRSRAWLRFGRTLEVIVLALPGAMLLGFATGAFNGPHTFDVSFSSPVKALFSTMTAVSMAATLLRRRWPTICLLVVTAASVSVEFMQLPINPLHIYLTVTMGYFVLRNERRRSLIMASVIAVVFLVMSIFNWRSDAPGAAFDGVLWVVAGTTVGMAVRSQRQMVQALQDRAERAESAREELVLRGIAEDRVRVARELHDIIAHHVSAVGVQTGSAAHVIDTRPDLAKKLLLDARASAARVLDELQMVLGVLRQGESLVPTAVQVGRPDIAELLATSRANGVDLSASGVEHLESLPAESFIVAYRLLQESLTNAHRHALGAPVTITVEALEAGVEVVVSNSAADHSPADPEPDRRRFGLIGTQERIDSVGGTLVTGPTEDGGFRVRAHVPGRLTTRRTAEESP
ncbi:MAG: sensor histidine kinase [Arachnia sp.]